MVQRRERIEQGVTSLVFHPIRSTDWVMVASIAQEHSLFEIDRELDAIFDEIEEEIKNRGEASAELADRFRQFCEAHGEKADRIGRFLRMMEARAQYCRSEASRLQERARSSERKATQTKYMVMYYLESRDLRKIEGREFTLRIQSGFRRTARIQCASPMKRRSQCDTGPSHPESTGHYGSV